MYRTHAQSFSRLFIFRKVKSNHYLSHIQRYDREKRAMELAMSGNHLEAVSLLCSSENNMRVSWKDTEKASGVLTADTMRRFQFISACPISEEYVPI